MENKTRNSKGQFIKNHPDISNNNGRLRSESCIAEMSKRQMGKPEWNKGKKNPNFVGEKNPNWIKDRSLIKEKLDKQIRKSLKYRQWRSDVFERDNYTCQICETKGGKINADHIKAFIIILKENNINNLEAALNCEELWNINNGRTLCESCHKKTENYGIVLVHQMKKLLLN